MAEKTCKACHTEKPLSEFPPCSGHPEWLMGICRDCKRQRDNGYSRRRNERSRDKVNTRNKQWAMANRERDLERKRVYNREHHKELIAKATECRNRKPEQYRMAARVRAANRRMTDMGFRLKDVLRKRMRNALLGLSKADRTMNLLGCSMDELRVHLQMQFRDGMNWSNYGKYGWHIDHIKPCCSFDLTKVDEQKLCFHFTNLQPLWARENWAKMAQDRRQAAA